MEISEARHLKELETENGRLKKLVADQALDIQILKGVNAKNGKPHAEENGRGDGRLHGAVQTSPGLPDPRVESVHGLLPPIVLATKAGPRGVGRSRLAAVALPWLREGGGYRALQICRDGQPQVGGADQKAKRAHGLGRHGVKCRRLRPGLALRRSASRPDEVWSYDFI